MKKATKKACVGLLTAAACLSLVMLTAESQSLLAQCACTGTSLGVLALCAKGLDKLGAFNEEER